MGGIRKQSNELQSSHTVIKAKLNPFGFDFNLKFGAPLGHKFKIKGLFWGIMRTTKDCEKQLRDNYNLMIFNGFYRYSVVFCCLKYWWRRRELNPRP